jgi:hypothetical protein
MCEHMVCKKCVEERETDVLNSFAAYLDSLNATESIKHQKRRVRFQGKCVLAARHNMVLQQVLPFHVT